jgi:hypothetical protein
LRRLLNFFFVGDYALMISVFPSLLITTEITFLPLGCSLGPTSATVPETLECIGAETRLSLPYKLT